MNYSEVVSIPAQCATCPNLRLFAGAHELAAQRRAELSTAIMNNDIQQELFGMLLDEGMSIEEAKAFLAENAEAIHRENILTLEEFDEQMATMESIGPKFVAECRPEGAYIQDIDPEGAICMSSLPTVAFFDGV